MQNNDKMPKKNFFSMQLDLSKFELATDEEKHQQDRMRESTSFFRDGMRRLRKNVVSMVCLVIVVFLVLTAFVVPLFYPYDFETIATNSYSAGYLAPMQYSLREQILKADDAVFMGWSMPNEATKTDYQGLLVIDNQEYLDSVKHLFITEPLKFDTKNIEVYAVWGVDKDHDGKADFGADLFPASFGEETKAETFNVTYSSEGLNCDAPVDGNAYVPADKITLTAPANVTADGVVFCGWSVRNDIPTLTKDNYKDYKNDIITGKTNFDSATTLYAVWGEDADGDGSTDGFSIKYTYGNTKLTRYRVNYNMNMGVGTAPDNSAHAYAPGDTAALPTSVDFTKENKNIFPHILGTDEIGRDYAIRVIVGMRVSLLVGIIAALMVVIIGVLYGSISGYFGGRVDLIMMRFVDIIYSLPDTLIIILLSVSLKDVIMGSDFSKIADKLGGVGLVSILVVFAMLYWVGMARLVRGQVLSLREQEFVLAAKSMGVPPLKIIFKHMLPNCISVIFISAALQIPSAIFTESTLSFLGVGVSIPMPSLGSLASDYRGMTTIPERVYLFVIPALVIFLIVLSLNLLGQGLRDAFDPKLREVSK